MTESDGTRVIVREERATYDAARLLADVESAKRRAEAARERQARERQAARERRTRDTREAARARESARTDDNVARMARATGDNELATLASRHAARERANARAASRRADPGAARHVARATARWDARRDGARAAAVEATATVAAGRATREYGVTIHSVATCRAALAAAEAMPQDTRALRRARIKAIHLAQRELRAALR